MSNERVPLECRRTASSWLSLALALVMVLLSMVTAAYDPAVASPAGHRPIVVPIDMRRVAGNKPSGLYAIDPSTGKRDRLLMRGNGRAPLWSPDGSKVALAKRFENNLEIWVARSDGSRAHKATSNRKLDQWPSWAPGSKRLVLERFDAFDSSYDNELFIVSADGSRETNLTDNQRDDTCPDWSPRGRSIVFVRGGDILKIRADGRKERHLTNSRANEGGPKWSPNGRAILFARDSRKGRQVDLFVMDRGGTHVRRVTDSAEDELVYGWSPDGRKVVFVTSSDGFEFSLWIVRRDGSRLRKLVDDAADTYGGIEPNWSRNGKRIVYRRTAERHSDLWTIRPDGSRNRRLTKTTRAEESTPSWYSPPQGCVGLY